MVSESVKAQQKQGMTFGEQEKQDMEAHPQVTFSAHGRQLPRPHTAQSGTAAALLQSALAAAHAPSCTSNLSSSAERNTLKSDGLSTAESGLKASAHACNVS